MVLDQHRPSTGRAATRAFVKSTSSQRRASAAARSRSSGRRGRLQRLPDDPQERAGTRLTSRRQGVLDSVGTMWTRPPSVVAVIRAVVQRQFESGRHGLWTSCWCRRRTVAAQTCNSVILPTMNRPNAPTPPAGETLPVQTFGNGAGLVVAVHGITASAMTWPPLGRRLSAEWTLVAPDLRGRGEPAELPGPSGVRRHVEDICALVRSRPSPVRRRCSSDTAGRGHRAAGGSRRAPTVPPPGSRRRWPALPAATRGHQRRRHAHRPHSDRRSRG